ncbi:hypothetical protein UYSO10_2559 [Kosakonia radicincitans]|nr:hypothetical protein UYSO10_2559 [Kosakonia radicincitans]
MRMFHGFYISLRNKLYGEGENYHVWIQLLKVITFFNVWEG